MKFTELLKLLERHYGTERLADIAKELDVTPQVVNNWKTRNHVVTYTTIGNDFKNIFYQI